ncbi:MAG: thymidine kinase [Brevibacterium sp.]|uniref:thymidine kinase n=1 Tax=Brevibacterium sp. TaxID=1701 RepID=UPI002647B411|nr:thymidine kinase [Brevibacterium sp.]MDN5808304.1 thymidine kinase [Brevibacterium sp.]MDN5834839.1 thymidine kinase [Brevibacterium sp.]MDN5877661.1 thymidine kinase [Brevibacterium sp.]MDN5910222.1 thymidine kinase [Brevibacterium sp.]MDN6133513.1 thymidine kinase [Brevibacterium sp.]
MNPSTSPRSAGRLDVIAGPMFSGKSEELMRRVRRAKIAGVSVLVLSHSLDTRSELSAITSHTGVNIPAVPVGDGETLAKMARAEDYDLVAIDEAQFFGPDLVPTVFELVDRGATVIVEGLCVTFEGGPFEPMPTFMAVAEDVLKLTAVCTICGRDAVFHQRLGVPGRATEESQSRATDIDASHIGGAESYVARCREHFAPPH